MLYVIASIKIKNGALNEFVKIFRSNIPNILKERGCLEYVPTIDMPTGLAPQVLDGNVVTVIEKWVSLGDLIAHQSAPHMISYREKVGRLVSKVSIKVLTEV